jgi:hypothetical protein
MESLICSAIAGKMVIRFSYENDLRQVEPFCYGVNQSGDELLRGYQVGGQSQSQPQGWKLFEVDKIEGLTVTEDTFDGKRATYNLSDSAMKIVFCEIAER